MFRLGVLVLLASASACTMYGNTTAGRAPSGPSEVVFDQSFTVRPGAALAVDLSSEAVVVETVSGDRARC